MNLTSWIALRYLLSRKAGRYAPLLTVIAVASVAIGMLALIIVMSVMRGFRQELADRLLGFNAHLTLTKTEEAKILSSADIEGMFSSADLRDIVPFVQGEVIAKSNVTGIDELTQGARVRGIEPGELGVMNKVDFYFSEGDLGLKGLNERSKHENLYGAIIGNEVVSQLSVYPDFGDKIELIAPLAEVGPTGEMLPNKAVFRVIGVFKSGVFDYDSKYILTSIDEAKKLLGMQALEGWQIRLSDSADTLKILALAKSRLPEGWKVEGWNEQNRKLFAALKLERIAMGGVLLMVILIASFAIVGVVLLVTAAKRKDIAILEAIGMTRRVVGRVFILHAALIGGAGSLLGLAAALCVCFAIRRWPIHLPASYYLDVLPVDLNVPVAFLFALAGVLIAVVSSVYPVRQAMKLNPVEVLRYE